MISKSLKVGDLFTDGDFEYKVLAITDKPGVYISKVVGEAKPTTKKAVKSSDEQEKPVKRIRKDIIE